MESELTILSEQLLRYRELLALSYAQKDAIQKGDLNQFAALLDARQDLIEALRQVEKLIASGRAAFGQVDRETERRLMAEAAALLEKLVSLDKENERLLEVKLATTTTGSLPADRHGAYPNQGRKQGESRFLDKRK